jgi:ubiquinone/menaquinone biosynthesis C-methylase UbiE
MIKMKKIRKYFKNKALYWLEINMNNILNMLEVNPNAKMLDCGCGCGDNTVLYAKKIHTKDISGIEINKKYIGKAKKRGINCILGDLNKRINFSDKKFDVIIANQVFEHLYDLDTFMSEMYRILKDDGYIIISTENLSSWQNIMSLIFGWQPFSLSSATTKKSSIGNPYSMIDKIKDRNIHYRVFSFDGLHDFFEVHNFRTDKALGAGYFPFLDFLARINKKHASFLIFKLRKVN